MPVWSHSDAGESHQWSSAAGRAACFGQSQDPPRHGSNTMKIAAMSYGDFRPVRRHEYSPRRSWTATPEDRNALRSLTRGAGTGEIRFTFSNSVSMSSESTSRKRLLPWHAAPTSNVRQAAYHCWAAPVFILAICTRFSSADPDKECVPSSRTESYIC